MRYFKIILSTILAMFIAAVVIWSSFFVIAFSLIVTPLIAWWIKGRASAATSGSNERQKAPGAKTSFKVIEAEYEIIDKPDLEKP